MNKLEEFERTGKFQDVITVDELIKHLEDYKVVYGNNPINITLFGSSEVSVSFEYYNNSLVIDLMEDE